VFVIFADTVNTQSFPGDIYRLLCFVTTFGKFLSGFLGGFFFGGGWGEWVALCLSLEIYIFLLSVNYLK
jgi:hypothetical protein